MLLRLVFENLRRRPRRLVLAVVAVALGSSLAASLLTITADIQERLAQELRRYGANIVLLPQAQLPELDMLQANLGGPATYLNEADLPRLKTIFWRNNILGFVPYLTGKVGLDGGRLVVLNGVWFDEEVRIPSGAAIRTGFAETQAATEAAVFRTGLRSTAPWWQIEGAWPQQAQEAILGRSLAQGLGLRIGDSLSVIGSGGQRTTFTVVGLTSSGGSDDDQVFVPLAAAQTLFGAPGKVSRVLVSALSLPKEKLAPEIRNKRPEEMTPKEYELWYCSPVVEAIATQLAEAMPGSQAKVIRQVAEAEGGFLTRIQLLVFLVAGAALVAAGLGVASTMTTLVLERRPEIGLMKALGAQGMQVGLIFLAEAVALGLLGGLLGMGLGLALADFLARQVFATAPVASIAVVATTMALALAVAVGGSLLPVRAALTVEPIRLLRGQ